MAQPFRLSFEGQDKVIAAIKKYGEKVAIEVEREIKDTASLIERGAVRRLSVNDEGLLRNSISSYKSEATNGVSYEIVANAFYAPYVEFGTGKKFKANGFEEYASQFKNRKEGTFIDFWDSMIAWVKRNQLVGTYNVKTRKRSDRGKVKQQQNDEAVGLAFVIAMKILKNGLRPRPFMFPAFLEEKDKMIARIKVIISGK